MPKKLTTEDFITKAKKIHGEKYDYSLVEYVNNYTKVKVICPIHGVFLTSPKHFLNGHGCKKCADEAPRYNTLSTEVFIKRSKKNTR